MLRYSIGIAALLVITACPGPLYAAVVFDLNLDNSSADGVLDDGSRWNAAPMSVFRGGTVYERSLDGGLRYSVEGGSWSAYRNQFTWQSTPSVTAFQQAVEDAFEAWTVVDPATGFGTQLSFVADLATPVSTAVDNFVRLGSEIDLFADSIGSGQKGEAFFNSVFQGGGVTLTSGTTGYGGFAIAGADITMNTNVVWSSLSDFKVILTHEIGHAIGLGDVEDFSGNGFIDNNYSSGDPLGTLTDPWAHLVDPLDPGASAGLSIYNVPNSTAGIDRFGVDILMESSIPQVFFDQGFAELRNDDFGGRQFLYPELAPQLPGDANVDGVVDLLDLDILGVNFDASGALYSQGDFNGDTFVDLLDLDLLGANFGASIGSQSVPEPTISIFVAIVLAAAGPPRGPSRFAVV